MRTIDLFAGCGGMSLGFEMADFEMLLAVENWSKAIECYKANFKHPIISFDLTQVEAAVNLLLPYRAELVIGGPPCQDFSHAGQRIEGDNANLTVAFAKIVSALAPKYFVFENVDRAQKSVSYARAKKILQSSGYHMMETVLDASFCGVPQKRRRFFAIGSTCPNVAELELLIKQSMSSERMTVREYMGQELDTDYFYRHPRNYNRRGIFSIDEPSPTVRGVNRPIPKGYKGHHGDPVNKDQGVRPLTTKERSRVQTFPDGFVLTGSKTDQEQMIGNAVPVNLAFFLANCLKTFDKQKEMGEVLCNKA